MNTCDPLRTMRMPTLHKPLTPWCLEGSCNFLGKSPHRQEKEKQEEEEENWIRIFTSFKWKETESSLNGKLQENLLLFLWEGLRKLKPWCLSPLTYSVATGCPGYRGRDPSCSCWGYTVWKMLAAGQWLPHHQHNLGPLFQNSLISPSLRSRLLAFSSPSSVPAALVGPSRGTPRSSPPFRVGPGGLGPYIPGGSHFK